MSKLSDIPAPELQAWAAEKLALEPTASADKLRATILRSLRDDGFVPPPQVHEALHLFQKHGQVAPQTISELPLFEIEDRLRNEVESFAFEFFHLPVDDRQQRLQQLSDRCAWNSPLSAWLRRLRRGVFLDPHGIEAAAPLCQLAATAAELFVLPPAAQVTRRAIFLNRIGKDRSMWRKHASQLQRDFPKIAALVPELLDDLQSTVAPSAPPSVSRPRQHAPATTAEPVRGTAPWWIIGVVVMIVAGLFRASSQRPTHPVVAPQFQFQQQRHQEQFRDFLRKLERIEPRKKVDAEDWQKLIDKLGQQPRPEP